MKINRSSSIFCITLLVIIIFCTSFNVDYKQSKEKTILASNNTDYTKPMNAMFPHKSLTKQGKVYQAGNMESYYIESIIPGPFINKDSDEMLFIVKRTTGEASHSEQGVYMTVFDSSCENMISALKFFRADEYKYRIYDGAELSYIFFAGSVSYTGWTNWYAGLWQPGKTWSLKWPESSENGKYYNFWEDRAVDLLSDSIIILKRKILPGQYKSQAFPEYTWEFSNKLLWDSRSSTFK
jgi:hypothetical protein